MKVLAGRVFRECVFCLKAEQVSKCFQYENEIGALKASTKNLTFYDYFSHCLKKIEIFRGELTKWT